jgi:hypothetical protein
LLIGIFLILGWLKFRDNKLLVEKGKENSEE